MDSSAALGLRLKSLLLCGGGPASVAGIVTWFGAMQAQDVNSGLWSFGVRLPGSSLAVVNEALERREAVRTWPMRGTVHFVPPADVHWMLALTGVRAMAGAARRRETLGLDEATAEKAVEILAGALAGGRRLTRAECLAALTEGGVDVGGQRGYHLLWYAAQRAVTVIAPQVGKEQTFVLLDDWVPAPFQPSREEALGILALRYFRSHGPATRKDFAGWTGLPLSDVKVGLAVAGSSLSEIEVDGVPMIAASEAVEASSSCAWVALPGFDEYMLGYKDRSLMASASDLTRIIPGGNGMFRSTIVRDGRVVAVWTRAFLRSGVRVTVEPLVDLRPGDRDNIEEALRPYADYLGLPLTVKNP
jgi:hypothetical protein